MDNELEDWSQIVCNREPRVLSKEGEKLIPCDAFQGHLTLNVRYVIHAMNSDLRATSGWIFHYCMFY
jgi:hypothetical protein